MEEQSFLGPTWMDDTCVTFSQPSPAALERAAGQIGGLLLGMCEEFAMTPNLSKGKTELMLVFQGRGANQAKIRHFGPTASGSFPIVTSTLLHPMFISAARSITEEIYDGKFAAA